MSFSILLLRNLLTPTTGTQPASKILDTPYISLDPVDNIYKCDNARLTIYNERVIKALIDHNTPETPVFNMEGKKLKTVFKIFAKKNPKSKFKFVFSAFQGQVTSRCASLTYNITRWQIHITL